VSYKNADKGIYTIAFYKNDYWHRIVIDDRIACTASLTPKFARCKTRNEIWLSMLEKAYAKLHGSYEALDGGLCTDALVDLVGGAPGKHKWKRGETSYEDDKLLWKQLVSYRNHGSLMGCYLLDISLRKERKAGEEPILNTGLVADHAYSILDVRFIDKKKLLKIRNPWGHGEWKGDWSDNWPGWKQYTRIRALLDFKPSDDGSFWICFEDFVTNFENVDVCHVFPEAWYGRRAPGTWGLAPGGAYSYAGRFWTDGSQYSLRVKRPTNFCFVLTQPDKRVGRGDVRKFHSVIGMMLVPVKDFKEKVKKVPGLLNKDYIDVVSGGREAHLSIKLARGRYKIVCMHTDEKQPPPERFMLTVWSDEDIDLENEQRVQMVRSGAVLAIKPTEGEGSEEAPTKIMGKGEMPTLEINDYVSAASEPGRQHAIKTAAMRKPTPVIANPGTDWQMETDLGETEEDPWTYCCSWWPCFDILDGACKCQCLEGCFCYNCVRKTWICDCCSGWGPYECMRDGLCTCRSCQHSSFYRCLHGCGECYCLLWCQSCLPFHDCVKNTMSCYCLKVFCSARGVLCQLCCACGNSIPRPKLSMNLR